MEARTSSRLEPFPMKQSDGEGKVLLSLIGFCDLLVLWESNFHNRGWQLNYYVELRRNIS